LRSRSIAVFGSSQTKPGTPEWELAVNVGVRLGSANIGVITGGYGGTMEAVSQGASQTGVPVIGVTAPTLFPGRSGANPYVSDVLEAPSLAQRIGVMMDRSEGSIAMPGSIGTATELLMAWNLNHIVRRNGGRRFPSVAIGVKWRRIGDALAREIGAVLEDVHWMNDALGAVDWLIGAVEAELPSPAPSSL